MEILEKNKLRVNSLGFIKVNTFNFNHRSLNNINIEKRNLQQFYSEFSHIDDNFNLSDSNNKSPKLNPLKHLDLNNITPIKYSQSSIDLTSSEKESVPDSENTLKKLLMSIELIPNMEERVNMKGNRLGSLFQLFNSEYFDIHLLVCYLDKKDETGIIDTLVNSMHKFFINESFFYIPQLCTMITYKPYYESLENYILDRCVDQLKFSLKIHWLISSYIESVDDARIIKKYEKLNQRIEMTLVNGRRATISSFKLFNSLHIKSEEEVYKHSLDKEYRLNYFEKTLKFYTELKLMCEKLKDHPKENKDPSLTRNGVMRTYLQKFNKNIKKMVSSLDEKTTTMIKSFFKGYILPFDDSNSTMDDSNSLIVNFLPEHSFCFSTKARVPVKITVEVVRVLECEFWDELIDEVIVEENINLENNNEDCYVQTEENNKIEENNLNNQVNYKSSKNDEEDMKINEFNSIDDFFKKINNSNKTNSISNMDSDENSKDRKNNKEKEKEKEINKIVDTIKKANENDKFIPPRNSISKRDSMLSNMNYNIHSKKEEDFLFDNSEHTINPFGSKWSDIVSKIKEKSRFKKFETYSVKCFIAKANDDLRQEVMTMQLIKRFDDVFKKAEIPLKLRPYEILITSPSSGVIEFLPNTISIDSLKKNIPPKWNLNIFFRNFFTNNFEEAQKNFAESLAAYSIITYMISIRDRHNGNILLDMNGNIIHIDFGFILGISPGNLSFESAPFKLTSILDGPDSNIFHYFKSLILRGMMELKKHVDSFVKIVEIMARDTNIIISKFVERFLLHKTDSEYIAIVEDLISNSIYNWRTVQYDNFQKLTNDIRP